MNRIKNLKSKLALIWTAVERSRLHNLLKQSVTDALKVKGCYRLIYWISLASHMKPFRIASQRCCHGAICFMFDENETKNSASCGPKAPRKTDIKFLLEYFTNWVPPDFLCSILMSPPLWRTEQSGHKSFYHPVQHIHSSPCSSPLSAQTRLVCSALK